MPLDVIGAVIGPLLSAILAFRQEQSPRPRPLRSAWFRSRRRPRRFIRTDARLAGRTEVCTR